MPSKAPGSVTPLINRIISMKYGKVAVTYTTCRDKNTSVQNTEYTTNTESLSAQHDVQRIF